MRRAIARLLQHVRPFLRRHRRLFFLGILALLGTDAMHLLIPWFTRLALDGLAVARDHGWGLLRYPALIVLAAVGQGVFRFFWRTNVFGFSRNIEWDLRNALFAHLQRLPLSYFHCRASPSWCWASATASTGATARCSSSWGG
ncbi:MAG: hypothetical protein HYU32_07375 [candidate division NC10 bacterium]|nr:hypothetical protein [candidate division NC10 bacterium]